MKLSIMVIAINLVLLLGAATSCNAGSQQAGLGNGQAVYKVALCKLLVDPKAYKGKSVEVVARITATKEGIDIWDPACSSLGLNLSIDFDAPGKHGFRELEDALKAHGLSDHPVIATMRGVILFNQYDKIRRRNRTVLAIESVEDVHQAASVERR